MLRYINTKFVLGLIIICVICTLLLLPSLSSAASDLLWDFSNDNDYTKSDNNLIQVSGGSVSLLKSNTEVTDVSQSDFDLGSYSNIGYNSSKLNINSNGTSIPTSQTGMLAQWRFENNFNDSLNAYNGTGVTPTFSTGKINTASNFDGNDYVYVGAGSIIKNKSNFSLSSWVKTTSGGTIYSEDNGSVTLLLDVSNSTYFAYYDNAQVVWRSVYSTTKINDGNWHNITVTFSTSGGGSILYVDGKPEGYNSSVVTPLSVSNNLIGAYRAGGASVGGYYNGLIDELAVYNTTLTPSTIESNYRTGASVYGEFTSDIYDSTFLNFTEWNDISWSNEFPFGKELVQNKLSESGYNSGNIDMTNNTALFHFNDTLTSDTSGNNYTLTTVGSVSTSSTKRLGSTSASFIGGYLRVPTSTRTSDAMTIGMWVKPNSTQTLYSSDSNRAVSIRYDVSTLKFIFDIGTSNNGNQSITTSQTYSKDNWHSVIWSYDGTTFNAYIDGSLATSVGKTGTLTFNNDIDNVIGTYCSGNGSSCEVSSSKLIDELAIFNRGFSLQEATDYHNRGVNTIKFQIRSCNDALCDIEQFIGPDNTNSTYYSNLNNFLNNNQGIDISNINQDRYFQYKVILDSETHIFKPTLSSFTFSFDRYTNTKPYIYPTLSDEFLTRPESIDNFCEGTLDINNNCNVTSSKPVGTNIYYQLCNDTVTNCNNNNTWKYWNGSQWTNTSSLTTYNTASEVDLNISALIPSSKYLAFRSFLESDGTYSPNLSDISLSATLDSTSPNINASNLRINAIPSFTNGNWLTTPPLISWDIGNDEDIGLLGYCIAIEENTLNNSSLTDPSITAGILAGLEDNVSENFCPFIVTTESLDLSAISGLILRTSYQYNISIKALDLAGNIWSGNELLFRDLLTFKYDDTRPDNPSFISMPSNFISTKDVTITWPINSNGASDLGSGVAGLQFKIGSGGTWYGDSQNGNENLTDLLINDGSYTTTDIDKNNLIEGENVVYFRTLDNAGNISQTTVNGVLKINLTAPSEVLNITSTPLDNTVNSYSFSWDPPANFSGNVNNLTYCYSIRYEPLVLNDCTFTQPGVTTLNADSFATQPGVNRFYIVARDEALNINFATKTYTEFTYSGSAPGIPLNLEVSDISTKSAQDWKLAVSWQEPLDTGAGVESYQVYRAIGEDLTCSNDFSSFALLNTVTAKNSSVTITSYIDTQLSQQHYSYCVKACDSANSCSAVSSTSTDFPEGKYTEPAVLVSEPVITQITTKKAIISWSTDRRSDSKIQFGLSNDSYFTEEVSISEQVTAHTIRLNNLEPGTIYYFRAKWTDEDGNTGVSEEKIFKTNPPPSIVDVNTSQIGIDYAFIKLTTKGSTATTLLYGLNNSFTNNKRIETSTQESTYIIQLESLLDDSTYSYKVILEDIEGEEYENIEINSFKTIARPRISDVEIQEVKETAQPTIEIFWNTNTLTSSIITYSPLDNPTLERDSVNLELNTIHSMQLSGLIANTKYVLFVKGVDSIGNEATSSEFQFTTATDSRSPKVFNIKVEGLINDTSSLNNAQLIISWESDELATSQVDFGDGSSPTYPQSTQIDRTLGFKHVVIIPGLKPSSVYHFRVSSEDGAGNVSRSNNNVTITPKQSDRVLDIVIRGLEDIFDFI